MWLVADQQGLSALSPLLARIFLKRELAKAAGQLSGDERPRMVAYANVRYPSAGSGLYVVVATDDRLLLVRRFGTEQEEVTSLSYGEIAVDAERASPVGVLIEMLTLGAMPQSLRVTRGGEVYEIRGLRPLRRAGPMYSLVTEQIRKRNLSGEQQSG